MLTTFASPKGAFSALRAAVRALEPPMLTCTFQVS